MRIQTSFLGTLTLAALTLASVSAHAEEVSTTGKGVVGGTLIGAEAVLATEAAFKVQPTWAYVVGGVAGGAAGGIGGYFIEQNAGAETTMLILAGGMALVIPTTVAVLSATAYEPPASYTQDRAPSDEPVAEPPAPSTSPSISPASTTTSPSGTEVTAPPPVTAPAPAPAAPTPSGSTAPQHHRAQQRLARRTLPLDYHLSPPALIGLSADALTLGVPAVELRGVYTRKEVAMYGVSQATEVRVPVLSFLF
ncbi:MAG: hypothetical protein ABUL62_31025 [Myxococcales bacterium]